MNLQDILAASLGSISVGDILSALLCLAVCLALARLVMKTAKKLLSRTRLEERARRLVLSAVRLALYLLTGIIVVGSLGIDMSSLVALLSVVSLGVTLAAEDVLANVAGGLVVLSAHPFSIGDYIEVAGTAGTVDEISINYTRLVTPNGQIAMLPNKSLAASQMVNYTALGRRRIVWQLLASYSASTETVKAACRRAIEATDRLLEDPAPAVYLTACKENGAEYTVYCWAATDDYWPAYYALGERLRTAFAEAGVEIPRGQMDVHIIQPPV